MAPRAPKPLAAKPAPKAEPASQIRAAPTKATPTKVIAAPAAEKPGAARPPSGKPAVAVYKVKDLLDAVATATGGKKRDVKQIVDATLAELATALKRGADLNLPPLGRARVAKAADREGTAILTLKLRLGNPDKSGAKPGSKHPLAEGGEDS